MPTLAETMHLVESTTARLCHDLSSLLGTVNVTLGMAVDERTNANEPLLLAREAADELTLRLKLIRAAWGPDIDTLSLDELRDLAGGVSGAHRLEIDLTGLPQDTLFAPPVGRAIVNVLLMASESLPAGGRVALTGGTDAILTTIAGPRAAWPAGLAACLSDEAAAIAAFWDARTLQMGFIALLARTHGLTLSLLAPRAKAAPAPLRLSIVRRSAAGAEPIE